MEDHLRIFFAIINLFIGIGTYIYLNNLRKKSESKILLFLKHYVFFFTWMILTYFVLKYLNVNLFDTSDLNKDLFIQSFFFFSSILILFVLFSIIGSVLMLLSKERELKLNRFFYIFFFFTLLFVILSNLIRYFKMETLIPFFNIIHACLIILVFLIEVVLLFKLFVYAIKERDRAKKRIKKSFAIIFLSRYLVMLVLFTLLLTFSPVNRIIMAIFAFLIFFSINIGPYIWVRYFYATYIKLEKKVAVVDIDIEPIFKRYNISKREQDIFKLLLEGKENKEIEALLFISYNTVKNHVYSIYQKVGVSNRNQFINLLKSSD